MADFSYLNKLEVDKSTVALYEIDQLEGSPSLVVSPATQANKPYFNALLKRMPKKQRKKRLTAQDMENTRDDDRELYAKHIINDWDGIKNSEGALVVFNAENAAGFLMALPDWLFDDIRAFCSDPENFVDLPNEEESEEQAKK